MRALITGATGTIGGALVAALLDRGDEVVALSRDRERGEQALSAAGARKLEVVEWPDPLAAPPPVQAFSGADAVVHLLGEPISQRWTPEAKQAIRDSRVLSTRNLVAGLRAVDQADRPAVLVGGSATGVYGSRDDELVDEAATHGDDFLAQIVVAWEDETRSAEDIARVALMRTGVVLSPSGGALATMLPFFRLGVGGPIAGGRQFVPWVHLDDVVGALIRAIDDRQMSGPVNVVAPGGARNAELARALGRVLHRPALLPVPGFAVQILYGEMAQVVLTGVHAVPRRLNEIGFEFLHPELEPALRDVLGRG